MYKLNKAIQLYRRRWKYQEQITVGNSRLDLTGEIESFVTEKSAKRAQKKIREYINRKERHNPYLEENNPIDVLRKLHMDGLITDDEFRKIDIGTQKRE